MVPTKEIVLKNAGHQIKENTLTSGLCITGRKSSGEMPTQSKVWAFQKDLSKVFLHSKVV